MIKNYLLLLTLLAVFATPCLAETQVIILKDGSQVKGDLVGIKDDNYTIKTESMGEVTVSKDKVLSINNGVIAPVAPLTGALPIAPSQTIDAAQQQLLSNPEMMSQIQALAQDPEVLELLSDPSLVEAIASKNPEALKAHPKGQALMDNPKLRAIVEQMQAQPSTK
jgi:hypothetical protein